MDQTPNEVTHLIDRLRALKRLKEVLASMPGGWEGI
jgi:hypothetical protein